MFVKLYYETGDPYWKEHHKEQFVYANKIINTNEITCIYEDSTNTGFYLVRLIDAYNRLDLSTKTAYYIKAEDVKKILGE